MTRINKLTGNFHSVNIDVFALEKKRGSRNIFLSWLAQQFEAMVRLQQISLRIMISIINIHSVLHGDNII